MTTSNFTVSASGGFVAPNGTPWTMRGLNAGVQDALQGFGNVLTDYPGLTAIRLNCDSGNDSAASIAQVVQEYTAAGIVVEVEDHSGNGDNVAWYQQMATMFKGNPLVFLETPNEPSADAATTAQNQIGIINAIRASGFANPIGLQPVGGYDQSNIPTVTAAVGTAGLFATPHIYYGVNDPNGAEQYTQSEIQGALQKGLFPVIDEFGNALDGYTADPQGMTVITSVLAANEAGQAGAVFWAMDNGNHPDGADSAFLNPAGTQLTPVGVDIQPWLSQTTGTLTGGGTVTTPVTPSPDGTKVTTTAASPIIDQVGNKWTLVQSSSNGLQIAVNGTVDMTTANVVLLETLGGNIVQENAAGNWYSEPGSGSAWAQIAAPAAPLPPSPNGTKIATVAASPIIDQVGNKWTLVQSSSNGLQIAVNGTVDMTTANVVLLETLGGNIVQENTAGNWYSEPGSGSAWAQIAAPVVVPAPITTGSGSDTLVLSISEDAYLGDAKFTVSVDGKQLGSIFTATASHATATSQNFTFKGDFGTGQHAVAVTFLNDAYGGSAAADRNLYVNGISYDGTATGQSAALMRAGPKSFAVSGGTTPAVSETGDHGSLAKSLSQTGTYTVGGDTFVLTAGNAASVTLGTGTSQIKFIGASSITLTGGSGQAAVTADAGSNKFVAGTGTLDVTGGGGKDAYAFHANGGLLKLEDFSIAKGDTLTVDKALQGAMHQASDGQGGTMITFGGGATHGVDIHGMATMPTTSVLWA